MKTLVVPMLTALAVLVWAGAHSQMAQAEGVNDNYARVYCLYYKNRAMASRDQNRRAVLWAEYRRCLKDHGGG